MGDLLEQSEVDSLLSSLEAESEGNEDDAYLVFSRNRYDEPPEVRSYDFKRPERVSKDQMRALRNLHESFARNLGASLSGFLRAIVEVKVAMCEQMTYSEFTSGLPNPTCFNLVEADGLDGQMCLEISPLIIYPVIDRLLGGTSQDLFIPQRPMTQIETRLISNVTNRGLAALTEAWSVMGQFAFEITQTESNPQLVQIVPPNEVVVVVGFELRLANRAGTMSLCIPYNVIEPVVDQLSAQNWFTQSKKADHEGVSTRLTRGLGQAALDVSVVLAETTITLADLVRLQPGDIVETERSRNAPASVCVAGRRKFLGEVGHHRGKRAIRVCGGAVAPEGRETRRAGG